MTHSYPWLASYPANIDWHREMVPEPLFMLLEEANKHYPKHNALDFYGRITSFHALHTSVLQCAGALQHLGVKKGTRVGILMPNCPQFIVSYYAILKAGGVVVNYNPLCSPAEIHHQIEDSQTEIIISVALNVIYDKVKAYVGKGILKKIILSDFHDALTFAKRMGFQLTRGKEIAHIAYDNTHLCYTKLLEKSYPFCAVAIDALQDTAVLQYTGGTTGVPKGCILTHANIYINTVQCGMWFTGLEYGKEMIVGVLPFFHVFAMTTVMNLAMHTGSCILLYPKFDIAGLLRDIDSKKPTLIAGVPTMFSAINNYRSKENYRLTSLKMGISGGAPLPAEVKQQFEILSGAKLVEGYGLSESSPVLCANPLFGVNKTGSIGLPFPGTVIHIMHPETGEAMQQGEIGEICAHGPQVMQGYLHNADETQNVLKEGFLHTGDLGYIDKDGYVFVVDRLKEMIISCGYKIYPRHVEEALYQHPDILEAAVIGVPHAQRGHEVKVFIVCKQGKTLENKEILAHLRERVAGYAMPHFIEFRKELPKSAIGKILKKILVAEEASKL